MFKDHFSGRSRDYARYRPNYPHDLFDYLARHAPAKTLAWDAATGSGQAALGLVQHFEQVFASDASAKQIENAERHARIIYRVERAEATSLQDKSVDLITVAQALHWFDFEGFYREARRVLKKRGVIAAWTYGTCVIGDDIDRIVAWFYHEVVGSYWPEERKWVEQEYRSLPFPFDLIAHPAFQLHAEWTLDEFVGYLGTWSATQLYTDAEKRDYRALVAPELERHWGAGTRKIRWPLQMLIGNL